MKVALISYHSFLKPGGVKRHILGLYQEFKKREIPTKIIAPRRTKKEDYGKDVILLGTSFPLNFSGSESDLCVNFNPLALESLLKKEKFDVLHFHNFGFPSSFQILERSKAVNILTFHADVKGSEFLKIFPIPLYFLKTVLQWKVSSIIGVSSLALELFKDFKGPKKIIPNGVDLKEFTLQGPKIEKFQDGKINILFLGRIEKRKGLIYLLRAYKILEKKFSNLRLIVVGEGNLKKECEDWIKFNKLKEVVFEGEIPFDRIPLYYRTASIFVSPAIKGESFGIVLLEAMASGLPVVAFSNPGYREVMRGRGRKFLAPPLDYKALAKKIEILIKNKSLRKNLGKWGEIKAQKYSWSNIADQVLDFYNFCMKNKKGRKRPF